MSTVLEKGSALVNKIYDSISRMDVFNFIRGVALLCVIGFHTLSVIQPTYPDIKAPWIFITPAWYAMWVFFFLSGYLLGKGFFNGKYEKISTFYISRAIRIVPVYLFFLLVLFLFYKPLWFINNLKTLYFLLTFTYNGWLMPSITGVGATWFISTIVQLYAFAPLVYKFGLAKVAKDREREREREKGKYLTIILFVLIALGLIWRLLTDLFDLDYLIYSYSPAFANADLFFGGMVMSGLTKDSYDTPFKKYVRKLSMFAFLGLIVCFTVPYIRISCWMYQYLYPTLALVSLSLVVYSFDTKDKRKPDKLTFSSIVKNPLRFVEYLGTISFTFYLYHSNFLETFMKLFKDPAFPIVVKDEYLYWLVYISMFIAATIWSGILQRLLEAPLNSLRAKFIQKQ